MYLCARRSRLGGWAMRRGWLAGLFALALFSSLSRLADAVAVVPKSKGKVSASRDANIVLIDGEWRKIDFDRMYEKGRPHPPVDDKHLRSDTRIVVLIAALRETRLAHTVHSFFVNASHPERVFIGIVQQNEPTDTDIVVEYCAMVGTPVTLRKSADNKAYEVVPVNPSKPCVRANQIRVLRLLQSEAHGPAYARGLGTDLVDAQDDFCMQIDAHTLVVKNWDTLILKEWGATENEYAVLSTYPSNVHHLGVNINSHWEMPHLCCVSGSKGIIVNCQAKALAGMDRPILSPFWAAGLSFSKCHAERLVPNDRNLKGVFAGEEYGRGVRLWTHGYDFYSISRPLVGTYYGGEKGGRGGWHTPHTDMEKSHGRLATLVGADGADTSPEAIAKLGKYGLGKRRSLEQYIEFTGIDPRHSGPHKAHCAVVYEPWDDGGKPYVPWVDPTPSPTVSNKTSKYNWGKRSPEEERQFLEKLRDVIGKEKERRMNVLTATTTTKSPTVSDDNDEPVRQDEAAALALGSRASTSDVAAVSQRSLKMRGQRVGPGSGNIIPPSRHESRDPSAFFMAVPVLAVVLVMVGLCRARFRPSGRRPVKRVKP